MDDRNQDETFDPKIEVFSAFAEPFSEKVNEVGEIKPNEACCACTACTACGSCKTRQHALHSRPSIYFTRCCYGSLY